MNRATRGRAAVRPLVDRLARALLVALLPITLAVNLGFFWNYRSDQREVLLTPRSEKGTQLLLAISGAHDQTITADNADHLALYEQGRLLHQVQLGGLIGGIGITPDGQTIYAGTSDGQVTVFDAALTRRHSFTVAGRVVGLAVVGKGDLVVAYGQGYYTYSIGYYPHGGAKPTWTTPTNYAVTALDASPIAIVYALLNSQVALLDPRAAGKTLWQTTVTNPPTRLRLMPGTQAVLVGDKAGGVSVIDARGHSAVALQPSQYPIHALAVDPARNDDLIGDANGTLYVIDARGKLILTRSGVGDDIVGLLEQRDGHVQVVAANTTWASLAPAAINGSSAASRIVNTWLLSDALLVLTLLATIITTVRRTRHVAVAAWRARMAYVFVLPALALTGLFLYYPTLSAIYYSLTDFSLRAVPHFIGLDNYRQILTNDLYFRVGLVNMVIIAVTSMIKAITIPLLVAELIFWLRNRVHQYVFRSLFVLPAVVPGLVFTLLWRQVYDPQTGVLNQFLGVVGLSGLQRGWLGDPFTALWAVIGVGFPFVDAFAFLILLGGLLNINGEYFDAAKVDGAGLWTRFLRIDLPLLLAQFRILLFFAVSGTVQGFAAIFILTRGGPGTATYVPALQMYLNISDGEFGYASAIGVILFAMILIATALILRLWRSPTATA